MNVRSLGELLSRLIAGPDGELVRGDLQEADHHRVAERGDTSRVRAEYLFDVVSSVVQWWWAAATRFLGQGFGAELRHALRGLVRRPGYASIVIITLALGIGATTTIYTVVDALYVRPLPYPDAARLVVIGNTIPGEEWVRQREGLQQVQPMAMLNLTDLAARTRSLERVEAMERNSWLSMSRETGIAETYQVGTVTAGFFDLLAVKPFMGRLLLPGDAGTDEPGSAVITYTSWRGRYGADPDIIGKRTKGGITMTIAGVLPPDFAQPAALVGTDVEYWVLLDPANRRYTDRRRGNLRVLGRLAPGATIEQARLELSAVQAGIARENPVGNSIPDGRPLGAGLNTLRDQTVGAAGRPVLILLGASLLLLLLACTNAANLLLVRGLERGGELSLRRAIGADRARLTAGLLAESISLSLAGGILGLGLAGAGVGLLHWFGPALPRMTEMTVNPRIALAGVLLSFLVGVAVGLVPAIRTGNAHLLANLRSSINAMASTGTRLRSTLAATQLALALVLGVGASLLFRSFMLLSGEPLGFQPDGLVSFTVPLKKARHWESWDQMVVNFRAIPGVTAAGIANNLPFQSPNLWTRAAPADRPDETSPAVPVYAVTPAFFETAGIPVTQGRPFASTDVNEGPRVVIINQEFLRRRLGGGSPLGRRLHLYDLGAARPGSEHRDDGGYDAEVVGVVGNVVQARVEDGVAPAIYLAHTQSVGISNVFLATRRAPSSLEREIRKAVADAGAPPLPVTPVAMTERIDATLAGPRFQLLLIAAFALTALLLSAIGLYGTLAFTVRSRTRELGIRMALGAAPQEVYRLVMRQGITVFAIGAGAGLAGAAALTRVLQGLLYRLSPLDPVSFVAAIAAVGAGVLIAALRPAGRAARIDPMTSIRAEG